MKLGDLIGLMLALVVLVVLARWVQRALTAYPGIGAVPAFSIEAGQSLSSWGASLQGYGRRKLSEESP